MVPAIQKATPSRGKSNLSKGFMCAPVGWQLMYQLVHIACTMWYIRNATIFCEDASQKSARQPRAVAGGLSSGLSASRHARFEPGQAGRGGQEQQAHAGSLLRQPRGAGRDGDVAAGRSVALAVSRRGISPEDAAEVGGESSLGTTDDAAVARSSASHHGPDAAKLERL